MLQAVFGEGEVQAELMLDPETLGLDRFDEDEDDDEEDEPEVSTAPEVAICHKQNKAFETHGMELWALKAWFSRCCH